MSKKISRLLVAVSLFAVLAGSSVYAQSSVVVKMDVPFEFRVGGQTLPSGVYTISALNPNLVVIRSKNGHQSAPVMTNALQINQARSDGRLIFNRYGEFYFLSQIWTPGEAVGRKLVQSGAEREIAAVNTPTETTILIAGTATK